MVATFDTAFHHTMPPRSSQYPIPPGMADKHGVRRYGFHGLAHGHMTAEAAGDTDAATAVEMFCYRVRKYIGAYLTVLGGADAIIFGGGIGENAPAVRARVCTGMDWCGLALDPSCNDAAVGYEARISVDSSALHAYVISVDEATIIVRDTVHCLQELGRNKKEGIMIQTENLQPSPSEE